MEKCQKCEFYEPGDQWCRREDNPATEVRERCPFNEFAYDPDASLADLTAQTEFDKLAGSKELKEEEIREAAIKVLMAEGRSRKEAEKEMVAWEQSVKRSDKKKIK